MASSCISFDSYIKPQHAVDMNARCWVVYPLIPTSNHNFVFVSFSTFELYILWFLHQTTTLSLMWFLYLSCISFDSYIKPQLHVIRLPQPHVVYPLIPTSNHNFERLRAQCSMLYILWFLHQTTTSIMISIFHICCISFDSYIKPQLCVCVGVALNVVYPLIPTSNHNELLQWVETWGLYILWFLHQTTTPMTVPKKLTSCISFDSYIKPQHNSGSLWTTKVVYPLIPTSNHNTNGQVYNSRPLYILWFLHQTTTLSHQSRTSNRCISFDSYIKPQPQASLVQRPPVVYPLIPTSNHNIIGTFKYHNIVVYPLIPTSNHNL